MKTLFLFINYYYYLYIINNGNIVKHGSSEHAYNELTDTVKWFLFPMTLLNIVKLTDETNCSYTEAKFPVPGNSSEACVTVYTHDTGEMKSM